MRFIDFELRGDGITLDALLKATGLAESGGRAKAMVAGGLVQVDGREELRKARQLRAGQCVSLAGVRIRLMSGPAEGEPTVSTPPPSGTPAR